MFPNRTPKTEILFVPLQMSMRLVVVLNSIWPASLHVVPIALFANSIQFVPSQYLKLFMDVSYSNVPSITPVQALSIVPDDMEMKLIPSQYW